MTSPDRYDAAQAAANHVENHIEAQHLNALEDLLQLVKGKSFTIPMKAAIIHAYNLWADMKDPFRKELRYQLNNGQLEADTDPETYLEGEVYRRRCEGTSGRAGVYDTPALPPGESKQNPFETEDPDRYEDDSWDSPSK